ncbi:PREDICTED: putative cytochrome c oxidase subunit 6b-like [Nicotiana attenuata]|uniref:Cytochrome c oxidase subunit 6b-like protein n=1 Tax=Nicotiana attenuata TaxID=49451 RepID=A0A1J6I5M6_NICAT|nr:PREDICTED: putative cytochrome c oxidase subunit 6b-like [Nicotiana attenuata]OIS99771.1 putative cytochrome c oxidase subunit 6b-like protein [Nicotiana attenuata]
MRARDVNKVAKGQQAPRPVHETGTVSKPPPPSSTDHQFETEERAKANAIADEIRHCYARFRHYHRCLEEKGKDSECEKIKKDYKSSCPSEWIEKWHEENVVRSR